jgi:hypothetical protein
MNAPSTRQPQGDKKLYRFVTLVAGGVPQPGAHPLGRNFAPMCVVTYDATVEETPMGSGATCHICLEENLPWESMSWLACQHDNCRDCLQKHIAVAVQDARMVPR